jgi:hypothetical protein
MRRLWISPELWPRHTVHDNWTGETVASERLWNGSGNRTGNRRGLGERFMDSEESRMIKAASDAKAALGCGLRTLAIWIGAVVLIALMIGIGVWISNLFSG